MSNDLINRNETDDIIVKNQENTGIRVDEQSVFKVDLSTSDITGAGTVAKSIGQLLEPRLMKKRLEQFENTLEMIKEYKQKGLITSDMSYSINGIEKNASLISVDERAIRSLILEEINKQINIESIAYKCLDYIDTDFVPQEEINDDWLYTFRDSVKNISSEELQSIWAKLLANEIQSPSTYSLRTLDTLKKMSSHEAEIFKKFINITIEDTNGSRITTTKSDILAKQNIEYIDILLLEEIGLLQTSQTLIISKGNIPLFINSSNALNIINNGNEKSLTMHRTTLVGTELANIVMELDDSINDEFIDDHMLKGCKKEGDEITYESSITK